MPETGKISAIGKITHFSSFAAYLPKLCRNHKAYWMIFVNWMKTCNQCLYSNDLHFLLDVVQFLYYILNWTFKTRKNALCCILLSLTLGFISLVPIITQASQENTSINADEIKDGQYSNQLFQVNMYNAALSQQINSSGKIIFVDFSTNPAIPNLDNQTQLQIRFINKETNSTQPHVDYKVEVMKGTNQVFSILTTHAVEGVVSIPFRFQEVGVYHVIIEVDRVYFQPIPPETSTFSVFAGVLQNTNQTTLLAPSTPSRIYNVSIASESGMNQNCVLTHNCFEPPIIKIKPGSRIIWTNTDSVAHTITSGNASDLQTGTIFASGMIPSGGTFSFTFYKISTYSYFCQVHPWMTGQIIVESDRSTLPSTTVPEFPLAMPILLASYFLVFSLYEIKFKK